MTTFRKLPMTAPNANTRSSRGHDIGGDCRSRSTRYHARSPQGGEWGLVAPAVFKTVVSARKRRKVGSIPTRLRHSTAAPRDVGPRSAAAARSSAAARTVAAAAKPAARDVTIHPMPWLLPFAAFALGAMVGSFLNVVIHRYPREESVVFPPSRCPSCGTHIKPYDNVPILAWLWLGGRCRACRQPISPRYPLVELANALFWLAVYLRTGPTIGFILISALVSMTIVLIYIDLEIQILPDVIDIPGIFLGLAAGALGLGALYPDLLLAATWIESLTGAAVGAGVLLVIALSYKLVRKVEGMGLG